MSLLKETTPSLREGNLSACRVLDLLDLDLSSHHFNLFLQNQNPATEIRYEMETLALYEMKQTDHRNETESQNQKMVS